MDAFPEELLTPPVPLVALLGVPELHVLIAQHLQAQSPPVASVFVPDRADAAEVSGKERRPADAKCAPPLGILKAEWVKKHRERIPAAAVVLVEKALLCGNAGEWQTVCAEIDQIKGALRGRNVKLVLLLVQATAGGEMSEERLGMLKRRAEVDGRSCIPFLVNDADDQKRSLTRLYSLVFELCANYYRDEVRRMRMKVERRAYSHTELTVRYYFKMGMYCEFRREWLPAVKCYEAAFLALQELFSGASDRYALQTVLEVKAVAEVLSLKVCTLLLHSGREVEAVGWFRTFMEWFRARTGPPEAAFLHWGWMARQYEVFGELLQQRLASSGHVVGTPAGAAVAVASAAAAAAAPVVGAGGGGGGGEGGDAPAADTDGLSLTVPPTSTSSLAPSPAPSSASLSSLSTFPPSAPSSLPSSARSSPPLSPAPSTASSSSSVPPSSTFTAPPPLPTTVTAATATAAAAAAAAAAVAVATSATAAATAAATTAAVTATATPLPPAAEGQGPFSSQSLRVPLVARVFQLAAKHMLRHRRAFDDARLALDTFGLAALGGEGGGVGGVEAGAFGGVGVSVEGLVDVLAEGNSGVEEPMYVGQACRLAFRGHKPHEQRPSDQEVLLHELVSQRSGHLSGAVILLQAKAHDLYRGIHAQRMMAQVSCDMAREYLCMHDYPNAKLLLDAIAQVYRRDSFSSLLAFCLVHLRSCARHLSLLPDFLLYSLELCTLPALPSPPPSSSSPSSNLLPAASSPLPPSSWMDLGGGEGGSGGGVWGRRGNGGGGGGASGVSNTELGGGEAARKGMPRVGPAHPFHLSTQDLPHLRAVLSATATFPPRPAHPPSPPRMGQPLQVCVSLLTHLPIPLRLQRLLIRFSQSCCDTWLPSSGGEGTEGGKGKEGGEGEGGDGGKEEEEKEGSREEGGKVKELVLRPGVWKRLSFSVTPAFSGLLECVQVQAHITPHAILSCPIDSPQSAGLVPFWVFEPPSPSPFADSYLSVLGQKVVEVADEAPLADVTVECSATGGLVGEALPVRVCVQSLGHALCAASLSLVLSAAAAAAGAGTAGAGGASGSTGSSLSPKKALSPPASPAAWPASHAPSNNLSTTTTTTSSSTTSGTTSGSSSSSKDGSSILSPLSPFAPHLPAFDPPPLPGYLPILPAATTAGDAFAVLGEGTGEGDEGGESEVHGAAVPAEILLPWGEQGGWAGQGPGDADMRGEVRETVEGEGEGRDGGERRESSEQQQQQQQLVSLRGDIKVPMVEPHGSWSTVVFVRWKAAIPLSFTATLSYSSSPPAAATQATHAQGSTRDEPAAAAPAAAVDAGEAGGCKSEGATTDPPAAAGETAAEVTTGADTAASSTNSSTDSKAPFQVSRSQDLRCHEALTVLHRYMGPFRKDSLIPIFHAPPAAPSTPTTPAASTPTTPLPTTPSSLSALAPPAAGAAAAVAAAAAAGTVPAAALSVHEVCVLAVVVRNTAHTALRLRAVRVQQQQQQEGDEAPCLVKPVSMGGHTAVSSAAATAADHDEDDDGGGRVAKERRGAEAGSGPEGERDGDSSSSGRGGGGEGDEGSILSASDSVGLLKSPESPDSVLPLVLAPGETFTQLFHVTPRVASPSLVIGSLLLTWQRHATQGDSSNWLQNHSLLGLGTPAGTTGENWKGLDSGKGVGVVTGTDPGPLPLDAMASTSQLQQQQADQTNALASPLLPRPAPTVSSLRPFPPVLSAHPILTASLRLPSFALVGSPFPFSLRLSNCTSSLQEVVFQLQDAPGFVFAGQHSGTVTVLPRASLRLSFRLVPVASGMLQLPLIRLLAPRPAAKLYPCLHTSRLFVFPSPGAVPAAAATGGGADGGATSKGGMMSAHLLQQD
ncbi:hypothetical protein CLOM_g22485 [Closterium sp. NIES-68]|nr:hypothetical protein CLOM_g22485 [Closterium sp. NIES-68]